MNSLLSKPRAPSPTLVIAVISLIVAVGGGAFAVAALNNAKAKKIANKVITRRAPGLAVASAQTAQTAGSANPAAFAQIAADGTVNGANSKGVTQANVLNTGSIVGYYCFGNLPFVPRGGDVTLDFNPSLPTTEMIALMGLGGTGTCPTGTQLFVDTRKADSTGSTPRGFFITLYH